MSIWKDVLERDADHEHCDHEECIAYRAFTRVVVKYFQDNNITPQRGLMLASVLGAKAIQLVIKKAVDSGKDPQEGLNLLLGAIGIDTSEISADLSNRASVTVGIMGNTTVPKEEIAKHLREMADKIERGQATTKQSTPTHPKVMPGIKPGNA